MCAAKRVEEIVGAVDVMRARMRRVEAPADAVDVVGTGGDGSGSYNVSTCTAIVAAACGLTVAKHGNRALSSRSGAADTLAALGANIDLDPAGIAACIAESGLGFMFAPLHHAAMRHVGPARAEMGTRTIFNLLGPLSNPASASRMLLGVFSPNWIEPLAYVAKELGMRAVWVVHGQGLDEVTTTGPTAVAELKGGEVRTFEITPEDAGLPRAEMSALKGGDAAHNAKALRAVLDGEPGAYRDIVLLNTARHPRRRRGRGFARRRREAGGSADRRRVGLGDARAFRRRLAGARFMTTALDRILAYKREEVAALKAHGPCDPGGASASPRFLAALQAARAANHVGLIAEVKKASPSRGIIRADFDPATLASAYEAGGATCLSVLTDGPSFQGSAAALRAARAAVTIPVLRKDFMIDVAQVVEARAMGADAILVIMAAVEDTLAVDLVAAANELKMDALVEVHDGRELDRALALDAPLIGINNRDLRSFVTDLAVTERLASRVPKDRLLVAESGIAGPGGRRKDVVGRRDDLARRRKPDAPGGCSWGNTSLVGGGPARRRTVMPSSSPS